MSASSNLFTSWVLMFLAAFIFNKMKNMNQFLNILLLMECMSLAMILVMVLCSSNWSMVLLIFIFVLIVAEASLGLSLLVKSCRSHSDVMMKAF